MIVCGVTVVILSRFTFPITFIIIDGYAWAQGLAIRNREVREATAGLSLANVLADSNFDALVSK